MDIEMNETNLFFFVICISVLYNFIIYRNYLFLFVIGLVFTLFYLHKPKNKNTSKKKIQKIIEEFDIKNVGSSLYGIHKIPKQFKYLFIKSDIIQNLIQLKVVKKFNNELYIKMFVLIEKFLRLFYNSIINRYDKKMSLDKMKQIYEEFKTYQEELKLNIPITSRNMKRIKNLHKEIDSNMRTINHFMLKKIRMLKRSLNDDKNKYQ